MPSPLKSAGSAVLSSPTHRPTAAEVGPADVTGQLLSALLAYKAGDFCVRLPSDWTGVPGKIADAFNEMLVHAGQLGANAVIGVRYDATELATGITEVLCYGTAVHVEAVH